MLSSIMTDRVDVPTRQTKWVGVLKAFCGQHCKLLMGLVPLCMEVVMEGEEWHSCLDRIKQNKIKKMGLHSCLSSSNHTTMEAERHGGLIDMQESRHWQHPLPDSLTHCLN